MFCTTKQSRIWPKLFILATFWIANVDTDEPRTTYRYRMNLIRIVIIRYLFLSQGAWQDRVCLIIRNCARDHLIFVNIWGNHMENIRSILFLVCNFGVIQLSAALSIIKYMLYTYYTLCRMIGFFAG